MKLFFWRCMSLSGFTISVVIVLLAVAVSISRIITPLLTDYRQDIQDQISTAFDQKISIGKIRAQWQGMTPRIRLDEVKIHGNVSAQPPFRIDTIYLGLDIVKTLLNGAIRVNEIALIGCDISIIRKLDHSIVMHGMDISLPKNWNNSNAEAFKTISQSQIELLNSRVRWEDEVSGADYSFQGINISLSTEAGRNRVVARVDPPEAVGSQLTVVMDFQGQLNKPNGWQGQLYVNARGLQVNAFPQQGSLEKLGLLRGEFNFEGWSNWHQGRPVDALGSFSLKDTSWSPRFSDAPYQYGMPSFDLIRGNYRWTKNNQGWAMQLVDLDVVVDAKLWPKGALNFDYRYSGGAVSVLRGAFRYANLQHLYPLICRLPGVAGTVLGEFEYPPSAQLLDTQFTLSLIEGKLDHYLLNTQVRGLEFPPVDKWPGMAGLDGSVRLNEHGGEVHLDSRRVLFDYPRIFQKAMFFNTLQGAFTWGIDEGETTIESDQFSLANEDIEIRGQGGLTLGEQAPHLDLRLSYANGNGARVGHYLPTVGMPEKVRSWINTSIVGGSIKSGTLLFNGKLPEFPFVQGNGVFKVDALIDKGILDYKPGWPRLEEVTAALKFRGASLEISDAHARVLDSELSNVTLGIQNMKLAELKMNAQVNGPLSDILSYANQTILPRADNRIVKDPRLDGDSRMRLKLNLPISDKIKAPNSITGQLELKDAMLSLEQSDFALENITGILEFGPQGVQAQGIDAKINGHAISIDARVEDEAVTLVEIRGNLGLADLIKNPGNPLVSSSNGTSDWLAHVRIPHGQLQDQTRTLGVDIWSDLKGIELKLPEPFIKSVEKQQAFRLIASVGVNGSIPVRVRYGDQLSAAFSLQEDGGEYELKGGEIRFYKGDPVFSGNGLRVLGRLPHCSLGAWQSWFEQFVDTSSEGIAVIGQSNKPVVIDVSFDSLDLLGQDFQEVRLSAQSRREDWLLTVDSAAMKGELKLPFSFVSGNPLRMELDYLKLQGPRSSGDEKTIDPRKLPAVQVRSKELQYEDLVFKDFYLETGRTKDGVQIHNLNLMTEDFSARVAGQWRILKNLTQQSNIRLVLDTDNLGDMLKNLDMGNSLEGGVARVSADLQYPAAPYQWSYHGLSGQAQIDLKNGRLRELEPGPGRVLGLINISALSRRINLDFSDLFKKGFSYDSIEGHLDIDGAHIYTKDMLVKGPAADLAIEGRVGLDNRDYDQRVSVTAKVSSGVTVAGALLGGVGVGAAIFVADKIINSMGAGIDNVTRLQYRITGSWDDPIVEMLTPLESDEGGFSVLEDDLG